MKKQFMLFGLAVFFQSILLHSQPITKLVPADMKGILANGMEIIISRSGNQLNAGYNEASYAYVDTLKLLRVKISFKDNAQTEFEQFAAVVSPGKLQLEMVDEKTGKSFQRSSDPYGVYQFATHETGHYYRFVLNGKVIGTGYKPRD